MGDISFDEETVLQKFEKLRDNKAATADELVRRFLNLIKQELACPLTILFWGIMASESVPDDWKVAIKEEIETWLLIIDRLVLPVSCVRFLQRAQCSHCKRCISYGNSVRLSHAGIVSKRRHVARCRLHRWIAKCV